MTEAGIRALCEDLGVEVQGRNSSGWLVTHCPFAPYLHPAGTDHNPSAFFSIRPEGGTGFNCFTCKQHGRLSQILTRLADFREENWGPLIQRVEWEDIPTEFGALEEQDVSGSHEDAEPIDPSIYEDLYPSALRSKDACDYLKGRKATKEAVVALGLRYDPQQRRVLFPVLDRSGALYGYTGRRIEGKGRGPKVRDYLGLDKSKLLLGAHLCKPGRNLVVVEGLFALLHLLSIGVSKHINVVATMGSRVHAPQADRIIDVVEDGNCYLLYDDDEAGDIGLFGDNYPLTGAEDGGAVELLRDEISTYVCAFPEDVTDVDDFTLRQTQWAIKNAEHYHGGHNRSA